MKYVGQHLLLRAAEDLRNYNRWIIRILLRNLPINGKKRVLDFGAGVGTLTTLFHSVTGLKPECVELDPEQKLILENLGFRTYLSLNEINGKFDLIYTCNVLEHIEDDICVLRDLKAKLASDGHLAIYVPAFEEIWSQMDVCVGHFRRYKKQTLEHKLESAGYTVVYTRYCDSFGFVLSYFFKYIGNRQGEPSSLSLRFFDTVLLPVSKVVDFFVCEKFGKNVLAIATPRKV